jgi:DNA-binding XRE family transcriptional regulator
VADSLAMAVLRLELGRRLAEFRRGAGLSQTGLGKMIGYARATVSLTETGHYWAHEPFWHKCDKVLDAGGALAAEYGKVRAFRDAERQAAAQAAQEAREVRMLARGAPAVATTVRACPHCGGQVVVVTTLAPGAPNAEETP